MTAPAVSFVAATRPPLAGRRARPTSWSMVRRIVLADANAARMRLVALAAHAARSAAGGEAQPPPAAASAMPA
jgi:hypothetical protein